MRNAKEFMTKPPRWFVILYCIGMMAWAAMLGAVHLYQWHRVQVREAYESVLVHGFECSGGMWWSCRPIRHWREPRQEE